MKKVLVSTIAAMVTLVSVISAQQSVILQKVLVRVNGEIFTQSDLEFRQIQLLRSQNRPISQVTDLSTDPGLRAALAEITPGLLVEAVDELLLIQHGREIGIKFTDEMFAKTLADLKKDNNIPDEVTFQAVLKQEGMTMADLRMTIERGTIIQGVTQRELARNMTLTDEESRQYYKAHPEEFAGTPSVTLREIFVAVPSETVAGKPTFSAAADEDARKKIEAARERVMKGEDFGKLVAEVSESASKSSGGNIGTVNIADLSATLSQLLEKMKPGDVSEPLRRPTGYQLIKLEARSGAEPEPFEKSRDRIHQKILESRVEVEKAKFIDRLYTAAVIEWKDDNYRKLYETARAARVKK